MIRDRIDPGIEPFRDKRRQGPIARCFFRRDVLQGAAKAPVRSFHFPGDSIAQGPYEVFGTAGRRPRRTHENGADTALKLSITSAAT